MPNGILRAGPFATSTIPRMNEPAYPSPTILPVNGAMDSSATWIWQFYEYYTYYDSAGDFQTDEDYEANLPSITKTESVPDNQRMEHHIRFMYQAAKGLNMLVPYSLSSSITGSSGDTSALSLIEIDVDGVEEFEDSDTNFGFSGATVSSSITGTASVTLPEARYPSLVYIRTLVSADGEGGGTSDGSIEVSAS